MRNLFANRKAIRELQRLPDRLLLDIGIENREDIPLIVQGATVKITDKKMPVENYVPAMSFVDVMNQVMFNAIPRYS